VESLRRKSVESPARSSGRGTVSNASSVVALSQVSLAEPVSPPGQPVNQFENADVVVTLLPVNERFPWVTPARFRPELVPEELMAPCLSLTVEEYVSCLEKLTTDMRFTLYNILYKRILVIWIFSAFMVLIGILFSRQQVRLSHSPIPPTPGPHPVRPGRGLAPMQRDGHLPLHVGQAEGDSSDPHHP
jgi:hypothetical protein